MKRREFWITGFKFGDKESCSQDCTVELIERKGSDVLHVRELLPGDVVLSADEFARVKYFLNRPFVEDVKAAITILDAAKGKS